MALTKGFFTSLIRMLFIFDEEIGNIKDPILKPGWSYYKEVWLK